MRKHRLLRNLRRSITRGSMRFFSLLLISAIGTAFYAGVSCTGLDMRETANQYYDEYLLADIFVMSGAGFSAEDIQEIRDLPLIEAVEPGYQMDVYIGHDDRENIVKLHTLPMEEPQSVFGDKPALISLPSYEMDLDADTWLNRPRIIEGSLPVQNDECLIDAMYALETGLAIGDPITLRADGGTKELIITGSMSSPRYISIERGTSSLGNGNNAGFVYASPKVLQEIAPKGPIMASLTIRPTSLQIAVEGARALDSFSQSYADLVQRARDILDVFTEDFPADVYIFNRDEALVGYAGYADDATRIESIGNVYPLILFLVAMLVALTTMTRMVEEERMQIGTLKALGFSRRAIIMPYVGYALLASIIGGVSGCIFGLKLFPTVIFNAYSILYDFPPLITTIYPDSVAQTTLFMAACMVFSTLVAAQGTLREVPAQLMRPKAPKAGKRVLLERITFIWNRLNFSGKVMMRNIFRYKKRFFMTIIGVAGCCALMMTGFGLRDSIFGMIDKQFDELWHYDARIVLNKKTTRDDMLSIEQKYLENSIVSDSLLAREQSMSIYREGGGRKVDASVMATPDAGKAQSMITMRDRLTHEELTLTDDGVILTEKAAKLLGVGVGDVFLIELDNVPHQAVVSGIMENYAMHYVFLTENYYNEVFDEEMGYNEFIALLSSQDEEDKDNLTRTLLEDGRIAVVSYLDGVSDDFYESMSSLDIVVVVFIITAALLAFVVMYNLTNINITERARELATLRVLGFTYKEMYSYIFRENTLLSALGALVGLVMGIGMHRYVLIAAEIDSIMFVREIKPLSFVLSAVLTVVFAYLVNFVMRRHVRKIDMVSSLKSVE